MFPAVVGVGEDLLDVQEGTPLVLDGDAGTVDVDPGEEVVRGYERRQAEREESARSAVASARQPAETLDGRRIEVVANVGSPADVDVAVANGAEGVGLLRTEFLFLERDSLPSEEEQLAAYDDIAARLNGMPLVLRTLDVGADKPLPYLPSPFQCLPCPFPSLPRRHQARSARTSAGGSRSRCALARSNHACRSRRSARTRAAPNSTGPVRGESACCRPRTS